MTEAAPAVTAGAMLRAARERQGLHIAALAASIKVTPAKLEALEADRYDALPDLTFARALAQAVCRALKIDTEPVLALLPRPSGVGRLEQVASGLQTPFHDRPGREPVAEGVWWGRPAFWGPALVLLAAAVLYLLPASLFDPAPGMEPVATTASPAAADAPAPPADAPASAPLVDTVHSTPPADESTSSAASPATALLTLRAREPSWVEVRDAQGNVLLSRTLQAGEAVGVDGALPLRATIGNAAGVSAAFRGETVDLAGRTRDNVARLELQ